MSESNHNGPEDKQEVSRRKVMSAAGIGWLALGGSAVVGGLALNRFMFPNVSDEPDPQVRVGDLPQYADMAVGKVDQAYKKQGILLVRLEGKMVALSSACTHLGCIVNWLDNERVFKCPCHGSGFTDQGINIDGPAPRPLVRFKIFNQDGTLVVDRSKKYHYEKGQWSDSDSFIKV
ncbi:MAG: QcrA and Rieske domain-containing protein [Planctomycetota bacterium]|jgi:cytochrome b6-f complex iron-sulfur subunit